MPRAAASGIVPCLAPGRTIGHDEPTTFYSTGKGQA
jgi:hypothetical protein